MIRNMDELMQVARSVKKQVIAVAAAEDEHVLQAVAAALKEELSDFILIGDKESILKKAGFLSLDISGIPIIDEKVPIMAAEKAVSLIRNHHADILMKGMVSSADVLKAVLHKEKGLRTGNILSMAGVFELPSYHKLLILTDPAVNLVQDATHKAGILKNGIALSHAMGIQRPKAAAICAIEKLNPTMQATLDAHMLREMALKGEIKDVILEGPMPMDVAISRDAALHKGIESEIAGDVDILLTPNLDAGNILYKTFVYLVKGRNAGIVLGAKAPIILTSRADSADTKMNSIALTLLVSDYQRLGEEK